MAFEPKHPDPIPLAPEFHGALHQFYSLRTATRPSFAAMIREIGGSDPNFVRWYPLHDVRPGGAATEGIAGTDVVSCTQGIRRVDGPLRGDGLTAAGFFGGGLVVVANALNDVGPLNAGLCAFIRCLPTGRFMSLMTAENTHALEMGVTSDGYLEVRRRAGATVLARSRVLVADGTWRFVGYTQGSLGSFFQAVMVDGADETVLVGGFVGTSQWVGKAYLGGFPSSPGHAYVGDMAHVIHLGTDTYPGRVSRLYGASLQKVGAPVAGVGMDGRPEREGRQVWFTPSHVPLPFKERTLMWVGLTPASFATTRSLVWAIGSGGWRTAQAGPVVTYFRVTTANDIGNQAQLTSQARVGTALRYAVYDSPSYGIAGFTDGVLATSDGPDAITTYALRWTNMTSLGIQGGRTALDNAHSAYNVRDFMTFNRRMTASEVARIHREWPADYYPAAVAVDSPVAFWRGTGDFPSTVEEMFFGWHGAARSQAALRLMPLHPTHGKAPDDATAMYMNGPSTGAFVPMSLNIRNHFAFEFWAKRAPGTPGGMIAATYNAGAIGLNMGVQVLEGAVFFLKAGGVAGELIVLPNTDDQWHHYGVQVRTAGLGGGLWFDRNQVASFAEVGSHLAIHSMAIFGAPFDGSGFTGWVADMAIYSGELRAGRFGAHYEAG